MSAEKMPTTRQEARDWCLQNEGSTGNVSPADKPVVVSFRMPAYLKAWLTGVAEQHGTKIGQQFATSLEDGLTIQNLIKAIAVHLDEKNKRELGGYIDSSISAPSTDECLRFIEKAVIKAMEEEKQEW